MMRRGLGKWKNKIKIKILKCYRNLYTCHHEHKLVVVVGGFHLLFSSFRRPVVASWFLLSLLSSYVLASLCRFLPFCFVFVFCVRVLEPLSRFSLLLLLVLFE